MIRGLLSLVESYNNRKIVLTTVTPQLLCDQGLQVKVQCKCKLRGLLQLSSIVSVLALKILGLKSVPQSYGAALNSNDSFITREVNSKNVFNSCSHVICGSEIDQYNYPRIIKARFAQSMI